MKVIKGSNRYIQTFSFSRIFYLLKQRRGQIHRLFSFCGCNIIMTPFSLLSIRHSGEGSWFLMDTVIIQRVQGIISNRTALLIGDRHLDVTSSGLLFIRSSTFSSWIRVFEGIFLIYFLPKGYFWYRLIKKSHQLMSCLRLFAIKFMRFKEFR